MGVLCFRGIARLSLSCFLSHVYKQCMKILISPHPGQHFVNSTLKKKILTILVCVKWPPIVISVCIYLMTNDVEVSLCACWLLACFVFGQIHSRSSSVFKTRLCVILLSRKSSSCILGATPLSDTWFANIFFHVVGCLFTFLIMLFGAQKFWILMKSILNYEVYLLFIFLLLLVFLVSKPRLC